MVPYDIEGDGERELIVTYTLGSGKGGGRPAVVQLTGVNVGDGQWHNISVLRERKLLKLSVDSDSGGYTVTGSVYIVTVCHINGFLNMFCFKRNLIVLSSIYNDHMYAPWFYP